MAGPAQGEGGTAETLLQQWGFQAAASATVSVSKDCRGPKWHWPWASVVVERAAGVLGGEGCWGFPVPLSPVGGSQPRGDFSDLCQPE